MSSRKTRNEALQEVSQILIRFDTRVTMCLPCACYVNDIRDLVYPKFVVVSCNINI